MKQLSKTRAVLYHLYPGILITICFISLAPVLIKYHYPPQLSLLICIVIVAIPIMISHLSGAKRREHRNSIWELNGYKNKLPTGRLITYAAALMVFAFVIWGVTQPLNKIISDSLFRWLPKWYTVQKFDGYDKKTIQLTLILNLLFNGFLAPFVEEFYFRGYLLPRMETWGKWSFILNAVLFSIYHFWQPYIYLTLILSLLPMTYMVWKTKDLRLGILTHCLLNIIGALLSFGLLVKG